MAKKSEHEEPVCIMIDGIKYPVVAISLPEIAEFQIWVKKRQPNPLKEIAPFMADFDDVCKRRMIDSALDQMRKPVEVGSPEFRLEAQSKDGMRELVYLSLKRSGAQVARELCDAAVDALSTQEGIAVAGCIFNQGASGK